MLFSPGLRRRLARLALTRNARFRLSGAKTKPPIINERPSEDKKPQLQTWRPDFRPGADFSGGDHNCFFVRAADDRFYDFADQLGLSTPMVTRGIALADVDGDGRLDFAVAIPASALRTYIWAWATSSQEPC